MPSMGGESQSHRLTNGHQDMKNTSFAMPGGKDSTISEGVAEIHTSSLAQQQLLEETEISRCLSG